MVHSAAALIANREMYSQRELEIVTMGRCRLLCVAMAYSLSSWASLVVALDLLEMERYAIFCRHGFWAIGFAFYSGIGTNSPDKDIQ